MTGNLSKEGLIEKVGAIVGPNFPVEDLIGFFENEVFQAKKSDAAFEKPDLLISCGAGIAPPVFLVGKILGCKLIFIEPYDFIAYPSLSGKMVSLLVDKLLIQNHQQKKFFKKAEFWGSTL